MIAASSIFFDINLPNAATWFYFSGLLAVALFFQFSRLLSFRNLDVLTLFLPMPGFLLLIEPGGAKFFGYLWLLGASLFFLARCLLDLTLVRRPALGPNLNLSGLAWLGGTLYVSLAAVAFNQPEPDVPNSDQGTSPTDTIVKDPSKKVVKPAAPDLDDSDLTKWVERGLSLLCHLSVVIALALIGWRHFEDVQAGFAAATFYLLLPYLHLLLPGSPSGLGRWDHPWAMALMVWAVFCYRRPSLAGAFLGLASGLAFFPVATFPIWLSFYRRAGVARFAGSFALSAGICLALVGGLLWVNGELPSSFRSTWTDSDWQPWKQPLPETHGFWQDFSKSPENSDIKSPRIQWAYRMPVFLASMALVITTAFWPTPKNLAHVIALSAAVLLSIQFWIADRGGIYVLWYLPFLLLLVFRPNLTGAVPTPPGDDWLAHLFRRIGRALPRRRRRPQPEPAGRPA
jgi:hypothetical protein